MTAAGGCRVYQDLSTAAAAAGWVEVADRDVTRTEWRHGGWSVVVRWTSTDRLGTAGLYKHMQQRAFASPCRTRRPSQYLAATVLGWLSRYGSGAS